MRQFDAFTPQWFENYSTISKPFHPIKKTDKRAIALVQIKNLTSQEITDYWTITDSDLTILEYFFEKLNKDQVELLPIIRNTELDTMYHILCNNQPQTINHERVCDLTRSKSDENILLFIHPLTHERIYEHTLDVLSPSQIKLTFSSHYKNGFILSLQLTKKQIIEYRNTLDYIHLFRAIPPHLNNINTQHVFVKYNCKNFTKKELVALNSLMDRTQYIIHQKMRKLKKSVEEGLTTFSDAKQRLLSEHQNFLKKYNEKLEKPNPSWDRTIGHTLWTISLARYSPDELKLFENVILSETDRLKVLLENKHVIHTFIEDEFLKLQTTLLPTDD